MKTFTVYGEKVKACGTGCADSFRSDRQHRLIYPAVLYGNKQVSWVEASRLGNWCVYCRTYGEGK